MAIMYLKNPYFELNSVDLSEYVTSLGLSIEAADIDTTAGSATGAKSRLPGLISWDLEIECNQDFAANKVNDTLWAAFNGGTAVAIEVRPTTAAVSATNPKWTGSVCVLQYDPFGGAKVGDLIVIKPKLSGTGAITPATS